MIVHEEAVMLLVDKKKKAFSHGPEFGRIIKMSHANRKSEAAQAVSSRLHARHPEQEFKPDFRLQTRWHIC